MTDIHFENSVLKHKTGPIIIIEEKTKKKKLVLLSRDFLGFLSVSFSPFESARHAARNVVQRVFFFS